MDLSTISTALSSIKTATEIAKFIKNSGDTLEQAEAKLKLADLISALADAKIEITDVQNQLLEKDSEIKALNDQLFDKQHLKFESPYYWLIDGIEKEGPFCQHCYDKNRDKIRLQISGRVGLWLCTVCKNSFTDKTYQPSRLNRNYRY